MTRFECPECGYPLYCGCKSCIDKIPVGIKPYIYYNLDNGYGIIKCGNCGYERGEDEWLDIWEKQLNKK